jgi:hypothetical protein
MILDHTASEYFTAFNETAAVLLDCSAGELNRLKTDGDTLGWESVMQGARHKTMLFRVRGKVCPALVPARGVHMRR